MELESWFWIYEARDYPLGPFFSSVCTQVVCVVHGPAGEDAVSSRQSLGVWPQSWD